MENLDEARKRFMELKDEIDRIYAAMVSAPDSPGAWHSNRLQTRIKVYAFPPGELEYGHSDRRFLTANSGERGCQPTLTKGPSACRGRAFSGQKFSLDRGSGAK